jgi:hypothetical protein
MREKLYIYIYILNNIKFLIYIIRRLIFKLFFSLLINEYSLEIIIFYFHLIQIQKENQKRDTKAHLIQFSIQP